MQTFFTHHGNTLPISQEALDYQPADLVTWMLPDNLPHIGIVTDKFVQRTNRSFIVHNLGHGLCLEDALFQYELTGHYHYIPSIDTHLPQIIIEFCNSH